MRNTNERLEAVLLRTTQLRRERTVLRRRLLALSSISICLLVTFGTAVLMPGLTANLAPMDYLGPGGLGSIFADGSISGYLMVALLAFILGSCVTIFCVHLHRRDSEDARDD